MDDDDLAWRFNIEQSLASGSDLADDLITTLDSLGSEFLSGTHESRDLEEKKRTADVFLQPHSDPSPHSGREPSLQKWPSVEAVLKAPTALVRRQAKESLTYLNQGQSYEISLSCRSLEDFDGALMSVLRLRFYERRYQVMENEKYEEWIHAHPSDRMLDVDLPMCIGVHNVYLKGKYGNMVELCWYPRREPVSLFVQVNCISSEFTKFKSGGESGIPFKLQITTVAMKDGSQLRESYFCSCQIKVFKMKGADRKNKIARQKLESLSSEEMSMYCLPEDSTKFVTSNGAEDEYSDESASNSVTGNDTSVMSPWYSQFSQLKLASSTPGPSSSPDFKSKVAKRSSVDYDILLTADSDEEQAKSWLVYNRFHPHLNTFANFSGADLLRLSRSDLIQLCGAADGIRLNNALQQKVSRPVLTVYLCLEWQQRDSGMDEYRAVYLERLVVTDLIAKFSAKFGLDGSSIPAVYREGPSGILILVDDEVIRALPEESRFVVRLNQDEKGHYRMILRS